MKSVTLTNQTEEDIQALAARLASWMDSGFIALFGELGAGKTTFTRAFGEALGVDDIMSPTFIIVREHKTKSGRPFFHFDAYRLKDARELFEIGFSDYVHTASNEGIIVMEWCENVMEALPATRLDISLTGSGDAPRGIVLIAHGEAYERILKEVLAC